MPAEERTHTSKPISKKDGIPPYSKRGLNDSSIDTITESIKNHLKSDKAHKYKIDLSENQISDEGIEKLVDWLSNYKWGSNCLELRLHKNQIGDGGAAALGKYLTNPSNRLEALHLSHNKIGTNGVIDILYGLSNAKIGNKFAYPRVDENGDHITPLWLRLERNEIPHLEEKLIEWRQHVVRSRDYNEDYQPICTITNRCRPHRCERGKKMPPPLCHLKITYEKSKLNLDKIPMYIPPISKSQVNQVKEQPQESTSSSSSFDQETATHTTTTTNPITTTPNPKETHTHTKEKGETSVGENLPFYILMDISAVLEMLELRNNDMVYPFSLPGLLALCNSGLMKYVNNEENNSNKGDDSERIVLIFVRNIFKELSNMSYRRSFLMKKFEEARDSFIAPLMKYTVIELLKGCEDLNFNTLTPQALQKAHDCNLSEETISTIQFAFVWAENLHKVAESSKAPVKRPVNCIFLTANPSVETFFHSLKQQEQINPEVSTNSYQQLPCITTEQMNRLLHSHFPSLENAVLKPGVLRNNTNTSTTQPEVILKASTLLPLLNEYLQSQSDHINFSPHNNSSTAIHNQPMNLSSTNNTHTSTTTVNSQLTSSTSKTSHLDGHLPTTQSITNRTPSAIINNQSNNKTTSSSSPSYYYPTTHTRPQYSNQYDDNSNNPMLNFTTQQHHNTLNNLNNNTDTYNTNQTYNSQTYPTQQQLVMESQAGYAMQHPNSYTQTPILSSTFTDLTQILNNIPSSFPTYPSSNNQNVQGSRLPLSDYNNQTIYSKVTAPTLYKETNHINTTPFDLQPTHSNQSREPHLEILRSELIGAISIVDELSNRLRIMGNQMPMYAEDCLNRAKSHILRWSALLSANYTGVESMTNNKPNGNI